MAIDVKQLSLSRVLNKAREIFTPIAQRTVPLVQSMNLASKAVNTPLNVNLEPFRGAYNSASRALKQPVGQFGQSIINTSNKLVNSPLGIPGRVVMGYGDSLRENINRAGQAYEENTKLLNEGAPLKARIKPLAMGGWQTGQALAKVTPLGALKPTVGMALPGLLNAGIAKYQGQDPARAFGRGVAEYQGWRPILNVTDPTISRVASKVSAGGRGLSRLGKLTGKQLLTSQVATRGATGIGNVIEDEILSRLDQRKITNKDRATSFGLGAAMGGNEELLKQADFTDIAKKLKVPVKQVKEVYEGSLGRKITVTDNNGKVSVGVTDKQGSGEWIKWATDNGYDYKIELVGGSLGSVGGGQKPPSKASIQRQIDELMGTDTFKIQARRKKGAVNTDARSMAKKQLEYYAEQGDREATKVLDQVNKLESNLIDRTQLTGKQLSTPNAVLTGKLQIEQPIQKNPISQELQSYEKGLTSSLPEQQLAQQGVRVKLKTQEPKTVLLTTKSKQTPIQKLEAVRQAKAQSIKANQNDFPSIENTIRSSNLSVKNKVNILDYWLRTPDKVLRKIGLGKEAESIKTAYNNYLDELPKEINKVTDWYKRVGSSDEASKRIFKYLDGQDQKLTGEELKVAGEIKSYLGKWADRLGLPKSGRIANYITHIFEQDFIQKEFDPELAKIIQDKVPGSVYDPFLQERLGKLGYVEDAFRALDAYVKRASRKANMDQALNQLQEESGKLDIDSWNYVKEYADRINLRPTDTDNLFDNLIKSSPVGYKLGQRPVAKISRGIRQAVYRGTLGLNIGSAIRNLTQGVNTYSQLGEKYTAQGYLKAIQSIASRSDELERVGVLRNSFIEDRGLSATKKFWENLDKGLFYFFEIAEKINRGSAYFGAKSKALADGLSEEEAIKAGVDMARKTQFTFGSVDTPVKLQSDIVKLLTQFQSFNVKQTEFLTDMAKNREYAGLVRWLGANAVILFTVGQAMGWDWKDMIPFGGVADGQSPIGSSPAMTLAKDVGKLAVGGTDKYGNPMEAKQILKDLIPLVPGGVQINKTIGGLKDVSRGYDESTTGRVKFPIAQTPRNYIQGGILGSYNLPEAKEYRENENTVMGEKQSSAFKSLIQNQGPEQAKSFYNSILSYRGKGGVVDTEGESSSDLSVIQSKFDNSPQLLTPEEIATYYESRVIKPKSTSEYENAVYENDVWKQVSNINSRESLTQTQKDEASMALLSKIGVSPEDYKYHVVAKQDNDIKSLYAEEEITKLMASGVSREEIDQWLVDNRKEVDGKQILTSGVIDYLVDQNILSYSQGKDLKSIKVTGSGSKRSVTRKSGKAKKPKKISFSAIKPPKVKIVKPTASSYFKAPKIKRVRIKKAKKLKFN